MSERDEFPRPLTSRGRDTLDFILSVCDGRFEELRDQARSAEVVGTCGCGCATIDLAVDTTNSFSLT